MVARPKYKLILIFTELPSAPRNLTMLARTMFSITVSWRKPLKMGNDDELKYYIAIMRYHSKTILTSMTIRHSMKLLHTFYGLQTGMKYTISIYAYNSIGISPAVERHFITGKFILELCFFLNQDDTKASKTDSPVLSQLFINI